ncbi:MAG: hypothetical protein ABSF43_09710 [Rectinemataceae bacterium]
MKHFLRGLLVLSALFLFSAEALYSADSKPRTLTCVGLYSETSDGYVSYRAAVGKGDWITVKVGDVIPANGEIRINVDRDWVELTPAGNPNAVYEIHGPDTGEIIKKVADIVKGKARVVSFPKGIASKPDPKYKDKLVVTQYLGRQIYRNPDGDDKDIKYGDVLDIKGKVRIIAINNTIDLMNASGGVTRVIGPLNFDVEKVLKNQQIYKYMNEEK